MYLGVDLLFVLFAMLEVQICLLVVLRSRFAENMCLFGS